MKVFKMIRKHDISGVSGTGHVLDARELGGSRALYFLPPSPFSLSNPPSSQKRELKRGTEVLESASKYKEEYGNPSPQREMTAETRLQLLFFRNDGDQGGEIAELWDREISLEQMVQHLRQGESILIIPKHTNEEKPALSVDEEMNKPWYFTHT